MRKQITRLLDGAKEAAAPRAPQTHEPRDQGCGSELSVPTLTKLSWLMQARRAAGSFPPPSLGTRAGVVGVACPRGSGGLLGIFSPALKRHFSLPIFLGKKLPRVAMPCRGPPQHQRRLAASCCPAPHSWSGDAFGGKALRFILSQKKHP